jgi:hypothetical protein
VAGLPGGKLLAGVFGAPPVGCQLATLATSSIPVSFGLPSSLAKSNSAACSRKHFLIASFTLLPLPCVTADPRIDSSGEPRRVAWVFGVEIIRRIRCIAKEKTSLHTARREPPANIVNGNGGQLPVRCDTIDDRPCPDSVRFGNAPSVGCVVVSYRVFLCIRFTLFRLFVPPPLPSRAANGRLQLAGVDGVNQRYERCLNPCKPSLSIRPVSRVLESVAAFINRVRVEACDQCRRVRDGLHSGLISWYASGSFALPPGDLPER